MENGNSVLVLGIGNLLMGDEGVGVHIVRTLASMRLPGEVELLDGGTGGFHLLSWLAEYPVAIIVDATRDGRPAGTITQLEPRASHHFPDTLSAHDIGLKDLIEAATLLDTLPRMYLITVSIESIQPMQCALSRPVRDAVPRAVEAVRALLPGGTGHAA
jgi:hydrogenase maturation protease